MKTFIISLFIFFIGTVCFAKDTYVRGHYRNNGTYVQPHYRTAPNNNIYDNYSTKGNINPYTGKAGTVDPHKNNNYGNTHSTDDE